MGSGPLCWAGRRLCEGGTEAHEGSRITAAPGEPGQNRSLKLPLSPVPPLMLPTWERKGSPNGGRAKI